MKKMITILKRQVNEVLLSFIFLMLVNGSSVFAQETISGDCSYDVLTTKTTIEYTSYTKVILAFEDNEEEVKVYYNAVSGLLDSVWTQNQRAIIDVPKGEVYKFSTFNDCGSIITHLKLDTNQENKDKEVVEVSNKLYEEVRAFQMANNNSSFLYYLLNNENLHKYEKIAFLQDFFLPEEELEDGEESVENIIDEIESKIEDGVNKLLLPLNLTSKYIDYAYDIPSFEKSDNIGYEMNGNWEYSRSEKAAAKRHYLASTGEGESTDVMMESYQNVFSSGEDENKPTQLVYNLFCLDEYFSLPDNNKPKTLKILYRYDTELGVLASTNTNVDETSSEVYTEDIAVVGVTTPTGSRILDANNARIKSACIEVPSSSYWMNTGDLAVNIATDLNITVSKVNDKITDLMSNQTKVANCEGSVKYDYTLLEGEKEITIYANQEILVKMFSFTNQIIKGKKTWDTESTINSNFYLAMVVEAEPDDNKAEFCAPRTVNWLFASTENMTSTPLFMEEMAVELGAQLNGWEWNNLEQTQDLESVMLKNRLGYSAMPIECFKEQPSTTAPAEIEENGSSGVVGLITIDNINTQQQIEELVEESNIKKIIVVDQLGRVLVRAKNASSVNQITNIIQQGLTTPNIYFFQMVLTSGEVKTGKLLVK